MTDGKVSGGPIIPVKCNSRQTSARKGLKIDMGGPNHFKLQTQFTADRSIIDKFSDLQRCSKCHCPTSGPNGCNAHLYDGATPLHSTE